ncbi:putative alpha-1,2-mannosidase [Mycetocola sp. BIGb0189]|uniref:glycoside hydrolase domain-containing protein n=1 Tax=Mycetocola sp. BIGb0189 TaxID=2940604 RepID=UPI002169EE35|nr:glycoside hydrolase domain-containing protein [Mycetocola sp. BIGb0189]MCS4277452.1 putative alpha-1,2-mannosidase [Mycetocola sp. BIGb0189]
MRNRPQASLQQRSETVPIGTRSALFRPLAATLALSVGLASAIALTPVSASAAPAATDLTALVNPFVSTADDNGNDLPGAQAPNGLAKVNPLSSAGRNHTGYNYNSTQISGFTHTNLDGVGGSGGGGDILVVPTAVQYTQRPNTSTYAHDFSHKDEDASPGYYRANLALSGGPQNAIVKTGKNVNAEVTTATRTAVHSYAFPADQTPSLVFDLKNNFTSRDSSSVTAGTLEDGRVSLAGQVSGNFNGAKYQLFYYAETEQPAGVKTWADGTPLDETATRSGQDTGAVLSFAAGTQNVGLRVTLSPISSDQAKIDQAAEVGGKSFEQVKAATKAEWNGRLGAVNITASAQADPTGELQKLFYTHLYRMNAMPINATSTSGTYRGVDGVVHTAAGFTYYDGWASWDDFRKYSVFAYVNPAGYRDMIQSLIYLFADQARAGKNKLGDLTQSVPSVRWERSPVIIADALSKGYTGFTRLDEAYPMIANLVGYYSGQEQRQGFVNDRPAVSVERGYDQWALAIIADQLGKTADAASLRAQSNMAFTSNIKPDAWTAKDGTKVGLLSPRNGKGEWTGVDYEKFEAANVYQGTLWQYHWYPAYDMNALIASMGGDDAARLAVNHFFGEDDPNNGRAMLHSNANEVDLQAPYLFNYVGEPAKTQKWVRDTYTKETWNRYIATGQTDGNRPPSGGGEFTPPIKTRVYKLAPDGFLPTMDNDAGTMSTMFVAAALGLFPVTAGSSQYQIGTPFFDQAQINYPGGRTFTIGAKNVSSDNFYVQQAALNGGAYGNTWLDYADIIGGGNLSFTMGSAASSWGKNSAPAYSASQKTPGASPTKTYPVTASKDTLAANDKGVLNATTTLTLGDGARLSAPAGTDLTAAGSATVSGVPAGITARVTVTDATTLTLSIGGTLTENARVSVHLSDSVLADGVAAHQLVGQGVTTQSSITLSVTSVSRLALQHLVDQALLVRPGNYAANTYRDFTVALAAAQKALANADTSGAALRSTTEALRQAADHLSIGQGGFRTLEAEASDEWSGGELKNEAFQSGGNLGGVRNGSWVRYLGMDFAGGVPETLQVRYANSAAVGNERSSVRVHAGDINGPVIAQGTLPGTGSFGNYSTVTLNLTDTDSLIQARSITFEFSTSGQDWVGNFDRFQLFPHSDEPVGPRPLVVEAESWVKNSGNGLKSESSTWNDGPVTNLGGTYNGAWLDYGTRDFGNIGTDTVSVHYVNNSGRVGKNARVDFYLDVADPTKPGTPVATVALPATGDNWTVAGNVSAKLTTPVTGSHTLLAVLRADTTDALPYVGNFDAFTFTAPTTNTVAIEAEKWVAARPGQIKSENSTWNSGPVTNVGGTTDGDWIDYGNVVFGTLPITRVSVHYTANANRVGKNSRIEFYLDAADPAKPGTPVATVPLPPTSTSNWTTDVDAGIWLPAAITGTHRLSAVLRSETDGSHPFVANIDRYTFTTGDKPVEKELDLGALTAAVTAAETVVPTLDRYPSIDAATFRRELVGAQLALKNTALTQGDINARVRTLSLAQAQLTPAIRIQLENALAQAKAVTEGRFRADTWAAFQEQIASAASALSAPQASDTALAAALDALQNSRAGLIERAKTAPGVPTEVTASQDATSVSVTWAAPADDGGTAITGYRVDFGEGRVLSITDPTERAGTATWLKPGETYRATVSALNAAGESAASEPTLGVTVQTGGPGAVHTAPALAPAAEAPTARAAVSAPFPGDITSRGFASDSWPKTDGNYAADMLSGFSKLGPEILGTEAKVTDREKVIAFNDKKEIEINNAASQAQVDRAQVDADNSPVKTGTDALGSTLGPIFSAAMDAGELPKTKWILDRVGQKIDGADAVKPVWQYARPFLRLGLASEGGLIKDSRNGGYGGLAGSGSYPSGHTYAGYIAGTTLATLIPELSPAILARASEYGNNRLVLGFHYPLDVMGGRMIAQAVVAHRWADPEFAPLLEQAQQELEDVLGSKCAGASLTACSGTPYENRDVAGYTGVYTERLGYDFPKVTAGGAPLIAPSDAAALLKTTFPELNDAQRTSVLAQTAADSGGPLDLTAEGTESWERINLARAMTAQVALAPDGSVTVTNYADETAQSVAAARGITVAGVTIDGFTPEVRSYVVDWPANHALPTAAVLPAADGTVGTTGLAGILPGVQAAGVRAAGSDTVRTFTVASGNGDVVRTYTVAFNITADNHLPAGVDPGEETDPGNGGTEPGNGGTDPGNGGTDPGNGGTDPGNGGTTPGNGGSPSSSPGAAGPGTGGGLAHTGGGDITFPLLGGAALLLLGLVIALRRRPRNEDGM